jgi:hypothetical protein
MDLITALSSLTQAPQTGSPVNPPPGTSAASNGSPSSSWGAAAPAVSGGSAPAASGGGAKPIPPELQQAIDAMNANAKDARDREQNVESLIKNSWQNVQDLQNQITGTQVPQMQKVQMSPISALATALTAGAMPSRYSNQGQEFTNNLLSGLARNNQTDYANQMAQHNQTMQVLSNSVQAARDEGNNLRYLLPTLARQPQLDLAGVAKDLTSYLGNQAKGDAASNALAAKQLIFQARQNDRTFDDGLKALNEAPPSARSAIAATLQQIRPDLLGKLSESQILDYSNPSPDEQRELQQAHQEAIKSQNLGGLLQGQISSGNPRAKAELGKADQIPQRLGLDDAHLASYYQILGNYDADHVANRAALYRDEFENRMKVAQAQADQDPGSWHSGIQENLGIQNRLMQSAMNQMAALRSSNKGEVPTEGDAGEAYRHLQAEIDHATRTITGLTPIVTGFPTTKLTENVLRETFGGYYKGGPLPTGIRATAVVPKGKAIQPLGVQLHGPIGSGG